MKKMSFDVYCDGGVIRHNPSIIGGTWAFCWVNHRGDRIYSEGGIITPVDMGMKTISNNLTELIAAYRALGSIPLLPQWKGKLYSDSKITLSRITNGLRFDGVPPCLIEAVKIRRKLWENKEGNAILLGGHPTREELIKGIGYRGYPVSKHNVFCDQLCRILAKQYTQDLEEKQFADK